MFHNFEIFSSEPPQLKFHLELYEFFRMFFRFFSNVLRVEEFLTSFSKVNALIRKARRGEM